MKAINLRQDFLQLLNYDCIQNILTIIIPPENRLNDWEHLEYNYTFQEISNALSDVFWESNSSSFLTHPTGGHISFEVLE